MATPSSRLFSSAVSLGVLLCLAGVASGFNSPIVKWAWIIEEPGDPTPGYVNVRMTPSVIDLTNDGVPKVVFTATSSTSGELVQAGVLRALRGTDGSQLFTVSDPAYRVNATSSIATGDIDGDGRPEIIACGSSGARLIAFEHDGTFKWRTEPLEKITWGAPAIADLNKDGVPEIVIGRQALDNNGNILWTGTGVTQRRDDFFPPPYRGINPPATIILPLRDV